MSGVSDVVTRDMLAPTQSELFAGTKQHPAGETYDEVLDYKRLRGLLRAVAWVMRDGFWRTEDQVRIAVYQEFGRHASGSSVSARLRELRRPQYGEHNVESRRRAAGGLWEYRVTTLTDMRSKYAPPKKRGGKHGKET